MPDPLNPDIVYGGKVTRFDRRTGQVQNIAPTPVRPADMRDAAHRAGRLLAGRSARAVLRREHALEDARRRPQLEADQPGPDAQDVGDAGERRQVSQAAGAKPRSAA